MEGLTYRKSNTLVCFSSSQTAILAYLPNLSPLEVVSTVLSFRTPVFWPPRLSLCFHSQTRKRQLSHAIYDVQTGDQLLVLVRAIKSERVAGVAVEVGKVLSLREQVA
jgi:hypothetical protein